MNFVHLRLDIDVMHHACHRKWVVNESIVTS